MEQVGDLQEAIQNSGVQVLVGFQFRFHPGLHQAKRLLEAGAIGRPLTAQAVYGEYIPGMHPWEDFRWHNSQEDLGGGVCSPCATRWTMRWLFGRLKQSGRSAGSS
jgi:predicted dehydrogenase